MLRLFIILLSFVFIATSSSCVTGLDPVTAPNSKAKALNQILIEKNGCGPASLINAYRFGSPKWNAATKKINGDTDKEKFNFMVRYYGQIFSSHTRASMRWDTRSGINGLDLTDLANDFQTGRELALPKLKHTTHFIKSGGNHKTLLTTTHTHLTKSLQAGFPPLLSVKRFAQRGRLWRQVHGHYVVLYEITGTLPPNANSFKIKYIDPWGGKIKTGTIKIPKKAFFAINSAEKKPQFRESPTLIVDFPQSSLGRHLVNNNEKSSTVLTASITP